MKPALFRAGCTSSRDRRRELDPMLIPAMFIWLLWACWDWHYLEHLDASSDVALFLNGVSTSEVPLSRDAIVKFDKGIEGVRIDEVKKVHEEGGYRRTVVNGQETLRWHDARDIIQTNHLASFFRDKKTGLEVPTKYQSALNKFQGERYNLYFYKDIEGLFTKFGRDIRKYEINPGLTRREKFGVCEYDHKGPLWALDGHVEQSEAAVVKRHVASVRTNQVFLKHALVALGLGLYWFVAIATSPDMGREADMGEAAYKATQKLRLAAP